MKQDAMGYQCDAHEEFLGLCARALAGDLSYLQRRRLQKHLASCDECRSAFEEYRLLAEKGLPWLTPNSTLDHLQEPLAWPKETVKKKLFSRLAIEGKSRRPCEALPAKQLGRSRVLRRGAFLRLSESWRSCAAGALVLGVLLLSVYRLGVRRGAQAPVDRRPSLVELDRLREERTALERELAARSTALKELSFSTEELKAEIARLRKLQRAANVTRQSDQASKTACTVVLITTSYREYGFVLQDSSPRERRPPRPPTRCSRDRHRHIELERVALNKGRSLSQVCEALLNGGLS